MTTQQRQEASVAFTIEPPYYRTTVAYVFYFVAAIFLVVGISYANSQRIRVEKERLEELVRQRTNELSERNQEIEQQNQMLAQQKEEILRQNENIQRQNESLKQLNEEKNHLIGILAHDLRNPLHQIKMLILLIRMQSKDRFTNDDEKYLALMEKSCDHLNDMITKILDIEAIESQKVKLKLETVHVGNFLRMMVDSFQGMAAKKNIRLQAAFDENFDALISVDKGYLQQVVENLITNAIKFSPFDRNVWVKALEQEKLVRIEVKDKGQGISAEDMKKLFGKFQKLSARPTGGESSTGLGLSIVKKYVEAMAGKTKASITTPNGSDKKLLKWEQISLCLP